MYTNMLSIFRRMTVCSLRLLTYPSPCPGLADPSPSGFSLSEEQFSCRESPKAARFGYDDV